MHCTPIHFVVTIIVVASTIAQAAPIDLSKQLAPIRESHKLPALAAAVVQGTNIVACGAVGLRRIGGSIPVTLEDKFHWGSLTKSMTATLAAMLVENNKLQWQSTLGDVFPDLKVTMHPDWSATTLEWLLQNRGGAPANLDANSLWARMWKFSGKSTEHRMFLLKELTAKPPTQKPGSTFVYSNAGFSIAGAMTEHVVGKSWEETIQDRLFKQLGMSSVGFGAPATPGKEDQPWGHTLTATGFKPVPPGPGADNPVGISPAGRAHGSILDLAKYAAFHLAGARGKGVILKSDTFKKLHTPGPNQEYAMGWMVVHRHWAKSNALTHSGSNTMFYAVIWIAPEQDYAVVVATNAGGDAAGLACDNAAATFIKLYLNDSATQKK